MREAAGLAHQIEYYSNPPQALAEYGSHVPSDAFPHPLRAFC